MKMPSRKPGFALISVLALVSVMVLLLGALMGTNRTAFALLRVTQSKDRIDRTVSSVYAFCRFQLEHDFRWARDDFAPASGDELEWGHLRLRLVPGTGGDVQVLQGRDLANGTSFQVEVCNNLKTNGEVAVLKDVRTEGRRDGVPSGFCRLEIQVDGDGHLEGAVVMVRNPGLVGGVCLANSCLSIDARELDLVTRDPVKNQARSLGETKLTGITNFLEGQAGPVGPLLAADVASGNASRDNPVIWSGTANEFQLSDEGFRLRQPFKQAHPDLEFRDERFIDEARSLFDIPDVALGDLAEVTTPAGDPKEIQAIPSGVYRFEQYNQNGQNVRILTRREIPASGNLDSATGRIEKFWYMAEGSPNPDESQVASLIGADSTAEGILHESTAYVSINSGGGAKVDVMNRRMVLDERYNFEVEGDFSLIGSAGVTAGNPGGDPDLRQVNPGLYFGSPNAIAESGNFDVIEATNAANDTAAKGSLKATGGIHIQGDISGSTTLAAQGDVTIAPGRFFDPVGNSKVNFSIFSESNVSILPPPILEDADDRIVADDGTVVDADGNPFNAESLNVAEKDLRFTGLIYAKGNVDIDLQDTKAESGTRRNLFLEGAVVSKDGHLRFHNAGELNLVYNPQFVDSLLPNLATSGQRRIEVTGWRVIKPAPFSVPSP